MSSTNLDNDEMRIDPQRASQLANNVASVVSSIKSVESTRIVRLIAVSKLKPASDVLALHREKPFHNHFGENYFQELQHKASILPQSIKWSFIGGLQTNKCAPLGHIPNLWAVNSIDTEKKANALEKGRREWAESEKGKSILADEGQKENITKAVRIFVQVNTSGEDSKSGAEPGSAVVELCKHVRDSCPHLKLQGLMTIGAIARSQASGKGEENEDFVVLRDERDRVVKELGLKQGDLELSMGMSQDYLEAIEMGSDEVRVGSTIFGERPKKGDQKAKEDVENHGEK